MTSLLCSDIIGRAHELGTLGRHLEGAAPHTLLICGEAGIGKSRLVAEAGRRARDGAMQVLQGNCYEPDRVVPYAPLLDMFRAHLAVDASSASIEAPSAAERELSLILPGFARRAPDNVSAGGSDPGEHRLRIFYSMTDVIVELAAGAPVLLIMEDLHWSDETSLDFLVHLARHTAGHPIRFLFSYRSDEVHPDLAHMVADLERERLAAVLELPRLDRDQLETMVRAIFDVDRPFPPGILDTLFRLTDGNPFFIEETLKSLVEDGDLSVSDGIRFRRPVEALRIPRTVHDAVQRRIASLSAAARRVLVTAAVSGHRFDFTLLQRITGFDEVDLLAVMKELMARQLVVEEAEDRFAFRHALTQEAIYADLLGRERRALHRAIAEVIEDLGASASQATAGDAAHHFFAAGVWDRALHYCREAGEGALAAYAPRAAIEHFTHAIHAAHQLAETAPVPVYHGRGTAYEILGDFVRACADYETAQAVAREAGDTREEWQALLDLALLWAGRDYTRVEAFIQRALAIARQMHDPVILAHSLNRLGNWYSNVERPRDGLHCHLEALDIFECLEDRRGLAETLDFLGMAANLGADPAQSAGYYERSIPLLEEIGDRQRLVIGLTMWMLQSGFYFNETSTPAVVSIEEARRSGERALDIAREMDWPAGEAFVLFETALWLGPRGQYGPALESAQAALAIAEEIGHRQWVVGALCALGALHLDLCDAPTAQRHLERALTVAHELGSDLWTTRVSSSFLVPAYLQQGDADRAVSVLDAVMLGDTPMATITERLCWRARAQLALARGDAETTLEVLDRLIASSAPSSPRGVVPGMWQLRGEALLMVTRRDEAERVLGEARDAAAAQKALSRLWQIENSLGKLLHGCGRRSEARESFASARRVVEQLAESIPDGSGRTAFLRRAGAMLPPLRPPSPARAARERFGGLTAREREVALRIAQGKSNRVIAQEMVVTERTIEGYVGHILGKLDFGSRTQIAAWAVQTGLTGR